MLLDHFGDHARPRPLGRCCDVCDPDTIGLPDPASLTPRAQNAQSGVPAEEAAPVDPPTSGCSRRCARGAQSRATASPPTPWLTTGRSSRSQRCGRSLAELATIKGVGPAFVERHGEQVLALVAAGAAA